MTPDTALWLAGIGIALAVPVTFMVANWVRKNVDHGEMRFGPDGKVIEVSHPSPAPSQNSIAASRPDVTDREPSDAARRDS